MCDYVDIDISRMFKNFTIFYEARRKKLNVLSHPSLHRLSLIIIMNNPVFVSG